VSLNLFLLVLLAAVLHAFWNYAARKAQGNLRVMWLGLCAACLLCAPVILGLQTARGPEAGGASAPAALFVLATGLLHAAYFLLLAWAYRAGELSVVYPVSRGTGVGLTALAAPVLFREVLSAAGAAGIAAIVAGIFLFGRRPAGGPRRAPGLLQALGVGCIIAAYTLTDKAGVTRVRPVLYIWLMSLVCVLAMAPVVLRAARGGWGESLRRYKREILIIGFGSMGTYLIILHAFTRGPVGYVVAVRELSVVAGAVLGFVFLREPVTARKIAAMGLVVLGAVLIKLG